jgi:hypothetical protein
MEKPMSTVIDLAQTVHQSQVDVTKKGVDALFGIAAKLVDAETALHEKMQKMTPTVPENLQRLVEPVESFLGAPADYAKWVEATDADWDALRRQYTLKLVDLVSAVAPKAAPHATA